MIIHPETRAQWLKLRHGYVSSTESAALFQMSPYLTAFELALEKQKPEPEEFESTERMRWGTRLQDAIADGIGLDYNVQVRPQRGYAIHPDAKMGASFDYEIVGLPEDREPPVGGYVLREMFEKHGPGILEIKNVDSLVYKNEWSEEPPDHIDIQLQHELECIGYKWGVLGVLVGGNRTEIVVRKRDETVGRVILSKVARFWSDLAKGKLPDPVMPQDAGIIIALHKFADPGKLYDGQGNAAFAKLCAEYRKSADAEAAAKEAKEVAKAGILEMMKSAEKGFTQEYTVSTWNVAETPMSFVRDAYRGFRVTQKKVKVQSVKE